MTSHVLVNIGSGDGLMLMKYHAIIQMNADPL